MKAKDIMSTEVLTVSLDTTVKKLAKLLLDNGISGAPVLDDHEKLLGIVTENDIIDQSKKLHIPTVITLFESVIYLESSDKTEKELAKMVGETVKDIYSKDIITVDVDTDLQEIATIMSEKKIHLIPVLKGNEMVGIVGKSDIVKAIAK